ncbi:MAG: hypothetical protein K2W82_11720 [Candidatus Obscuribacterales bacterium]|nr:hypothetical protein [Candidatus Obscuribacterales bacterium]
MPDPTNQNQPGTEPLYAKERDPDRDFLVGGKTVEQNAKEQLFHAAWFVQPENMGHHIKDESNFQHDICYLSKIKSAFSNEREYGFEFAKKDYLTAIEAADGINQKQIHQERCDVASNVYAIDYKLKNQSTDAEKQQLTTQREANLKIEDQLYTAYLGPATSRINYGFALIRSGNVAEGEKYVREGLSKRPEIEKDRNFQACWAKACEIGTAKNSPQKPIALPTIPPVKPTETVPPAEIDFYSFHGDRVADGPQDRSPVHNRPSPERNQVDKNANSWLNYVENRPDFPAPVADTPKAPEPAPPLPPKITVQPEAPARVPKPLPAIAKPEVTAPAPTVDQPKTTDTVKDDSDWDSYAKTFGLGVLAAGATWAFHKYGLPIIRSLNEGDQVGPTTDRTRVEERTDINRRRVLAKDARTGEELSWDTYDAKNRQFTKPDGSAVPVKDAQFIIQIQNTLPDTAKQAEIKRGKGELALRLAGNQNLVPLIDSVKTEATTSVDGKDSLVIKHADGTEKQILGTRDGKMQVIDSNKIVPIEPGASDNVVLKVHGDAESVRQATKEARHIESLTKILCADAAPTAKTLNELEKKIVAEKEQFRNGEVQLQQDKQALRQKAETLNQTDNTLSAERAKLERERVTVAQAETQLADRKAELAQKEITHAEAQQEADKITAKIQKLEAESAEFSREIEVVDELTGTKEKMPRGEIVDPTYEQQFWLEVDIDDARNDWNKEEEKLSKEALEIAQEKAAINKEAIDLNQRKSDLADNFKVQDQKELAQVQERQKLNQETDSVLRAEKVLREEQARNLSELEWLAEEKAKLPGFETEAKREKANVSQAKAILETKEQARAENANTLKLSNQNLEQKQAALTQSINSHNPVQFTNNRESLLAEQAEIKQALEEAELRCQMPLLDTVRRPKPEAVKDNTKIDPGKELKKITSVQQTIDQANSDLEKAQTDLDTRTAKKEAEIKESESKLDPNKAVEQTELREWTTLLYEERGDLLTEQEKLNERKAELLKRQATLDAASATKFPTTTEAADPAVTAEIERRKASRQKQAAQEAAVETSKATTETRMSELIERMQLLEPAADSKPSVAPTNPTQADLTVESLMLERDYADLVAENKAEKRANLDVYQDLFRARSQGLLKKNWAESTADRATELTKFVQEFAKSTRLKNDPLAKNVTVIADGTNSNYLAVKHNGAEVEIKERNATHAQTVDGKSIPLAELSVELHVPEQYLAEAKSNPAGYDRAANHVLSSLYGQLYELNGLGQGDAVAGKQSAQLSASHMGYQLNGRTLVEGQQPAPRAIDLELNNSRLLFIEAQGSEAVAMTLETDGRVGISIINNDGTIKQLDASNQTVEKTYDNMIKSVDTALEEAREQRNERLVESLEAQRKHIESARTKYLSDAAHRAKVDGSFGKYLERVAKAAKSRPGQVVTVLFLSGLAMQQMHKEQPELGFDLDFEVKGTKTH